LRFSSAWFFFHQFDWHQGGWKDTDYYGSRPVIANGHVYYCRHALSESGTVFTVHAQRATSMFFATGFVFFSYAGLLKIASVAEEIKNPSRNIPLGMITSLLVVSVLYALMVFVTTGVIEADKLSQSFTPISDGAEVFMGSAGRIALSIAAVLAFLSTANAGIMTAARSLIPLSQDGLLPGFLGWTNARFRTPHNALMVSVRFLERGDFCVIDRYNKRVPELTEPMR